MPGGVQSIPRAHLSLRYISEVGRMIIGHHQTDPGEIKEADKIANEKVLLEMDDDDDGDEDHNHRSGGHELESSIHDLSPSLWHGLDVWRCCVHLSTGLKEGLHALALCGSGVASENWVDAATALQVIGEAAKSNLSVLRTLQNLGKGIIPVQNLDDSDMKDSQFDSSESKEHTLANELDSIISNISLDSSAQEEEFPELEEEEEDTEEEMEEKKRSWSSDALLPRHLKSGEEGTHSKSSRHASMTALVGTPQAVKEEDLSGESIDGRITEQSSHGSIADISTGEESLDSAGGINPNNVEVTSTDDSDLAPGDNSGTDAMREDVTQMKSLKATPTVKREVTWDENLTEKSSSRGHSGGYNPSRSSMRSGTRSPKSVTIDPVPNTAYYAEIGTSLPSGGRASQATSMTSYTNIPVPDVPGIHGWRWEVVFNYTEVMTALCLHGNTANIQKIALLGNGKQKVKKYKDDDSKILESAGLLDMVEFHASTETGEKGQSDWSWRIRYAAVQGLVKICRCVQGDKCREGLRTVAWNALMRCHSKERDDRVLEAFKVGQVEAELEAKRKENQSDSPVENLNAKLAAGLASIYLPPLPPPVQSPKPMTTRKQQRKSPIPSVKPTGRTKMRPTLREEVMMSMALHEPQVNYNMRTSLDLKRIVEDQWRKELQNKLEEEEKENEKELEKKQQREEERQKEIDAKRIEKLKKKPVSSK
ncbi:uncharacterized protein [Ptychodera flava]|uniref:uncharacterized protein n=1 Tax=Ptychodera flava TaxID=63121 RepID=UPI00396A4C77